jgi:hypothetical protein
MEGQDMFIAYGLVDYSRAWSCPCGTIRGIQVCAQRRAALGSRRRGCRCSPSLRTDISVYLERRRLPTVPVQEKGPLGSRIGQAIGDVLFVLVRPVVERQGDLVLVDASLDDGHVSLLQLSRGGGDEHGERQGGDGGCGEFAEHVGG